MSQNCSLKKTIKNLLIIGDSYSTFEGYIPEGYHPFYPIHKNSRVDKVTDTWWHKFVTETEANLVRNDSWSGSTVCYTGRNSPEYGYRSSFVNRFHLMKKEDFFKKNEIDTVLIFGGTNDSWLDTTPKGEEMLEGWTEESLYSTLPAISYLIAKLKEEIPDGNIIFIINTELDERIVNAIKSASEHFGTSYVELHDFDKVEGHPTPVGMANICNQILKAIN